MGDAATAEITVADVAVKLEPHVLARNAAAAARLAKHAQATKILGGGGQAQEPARLRLGPTARAAQALRRALLRQRTSVRVSGAASTTQWPW